MAMTEEEKRRQQQLSANAGTGTTTQQPAQVQGTAAQTQGTGATYQVQGGTQNPSITGGASVTGYGQTQHPGTYQYQNQAELQGLYNQIVNRPKFAFNLETNPLWRSYRDQYTTLGQQAMRDTMGQAAGLTGGYGSSYSQGVGQQAYNAYLRQLYDMVPTIYQQERDAYDAEGNRLLQLYGMAQDREALEYNRYNDSYNRWWAEQQAAQDQANWGAQFTWQQAQQEWENQFQREQFDWQKAQAAAAAAAAGNSSGGDKKYTPGNPTPTPTPDDDHKDYGKNIDYDTLVSYCAQIAYKLGFTGRGNGTGPQIDINDAKDMLDYLLANVYPKAYKNAIMTYLRDNGIISW